MEHQLRDLLNAGRGDAGALFHSERMVGLFQLHKRFSPDLAGGDVAGQLGGWLPANAWLGADPAEVGRLLLPARGVPRLMGSAYGFDTISASLFSRCLGAGRWVSVISCISVRPA